MCLGSQAHCNGDVYNPQALLAEAEEKYQALLGGMQSSSELMDDNSDYISQLRGALVGQNDGATWDELVRL